MPTLLHIDSSPLYGTSISRELTAAFVQHWKDANPGGTVFTRDLTITKIAPVDATWVGAAFTPAEHRSPEQTEILSLSDTLISELELADEYVIGVPMHNFGVPSALKLWIDQVVRLGKTFAYVDGKPAGQLGGKKATFAIATGGVYDAETQMASFNFVEPYLKAVCGFVGVTSTNFLTAGGTAGLNHGLDRSAFLAPHLHSVKTHVERSLGGAA